METQNYHEAFSTPQNTEVLQKEVSALASSILTARATSLRQELSSLSSDAREKRLKSNSAEASLNLYGWVLSLNPSDVYDQALDDNPIVVYDTEQGIQTGQNDAIPYKVSSVHGVKQENGNRMIHCTIQSLNTDGAVVTKVVHIREDVFLRSQVISSQNVISQDSVLTPQQKKIIELDAKNALGNAVDIPSNIRSIIESEAREQGMLLIDPLRKLIDIKLPKHEGDGLTPEQNAANAKREAALRNIGDGTLATPEAFAGVLSIVGPEEIDASIQATQEAILRIEQKILSLSQEIDGASDEQKALLVSQIDANKKELEDLKGSAQHMERAKSFFKSEEELLNTFRVLQSKKLPKEVAESINNKLSKGELIEAMVDMVKERFDTLSEEKRAKILRELGQQSLDVAKFASVGMGLLFIMLLFSALKE